MKLAVLTFLFALQPVTFAQSDSVDDPQPPRACVDDHWHWQLGEDGAMHAACDPGHPGSCRRIGFGGATCCCAE